MGLNVNRNGGVILDFKDKVFGFLACLSIVGIASLFSMGYGLGEFLVKKLIERKRKRTGGSFSELYEDNKPDNKKGD